MRELYKVLNYKFKDEGLLKRALTHSSAGKESYERLEFLGDAVLGVVTAEALYKRYPDETEGRLSRLRAAIVNRDSLARIAVLSHISAHIVLGEGERRAGGSDRPSILSDVMEAIIGALYLDGGIEACKNFVGQWFESEMDKIQELPNVKDPKSMLQEWAQSQKLDLPLYEVIATAGKAHNQIFRVSCAIEGRKEMTYGEARSRKKAEQEAARLYLELIKTV